jgi:Scavenger receptor cysteine-rich domain
VQTQVQGLWGSFCGGRFLSPENAAVVCRGSGFDTTGARSLDPYFAISVSTTPVVTTERFECAGTEADLGDCPDAVADYDAYDPLLEFCDTYHTTQVTCNDGSGDKGALLVIAHTASSMCSTLQS